MYPYTSRSKRRLPAEGLCATAQLVGNLCPQHKDMRRIAQQILAAWRPTPGQQQTRGLPFRTPDSRMHALSPPPFWCVGGAAPTPALAAQPAQDCRRLASPSSSCRFHALHAPRAAACPVVILPSLLLHCSSLVVVARSSHPLLPSTLVSRLPPLGDTPWATPSCPRSPVNSIFCFACGFPGPPLSPLSAPLSFTLLRYPRSRCASLTI